MHNIVILLTFLLFWDVKHSSFSVFVLNAWRYFLYTKDFAREKFEAEL